MIDTASRSSIATLETAAFKEQKFNELFAVLEDLLKRIADTDDPGIRAKRAQVRAEMLAVRAEPHTLVDESQVPEAGSITAPAAYDTQTGAVQQVLIALAGAAMALSVFRQSG